MGIYTLKLDPAGGLSLLNGAGAPVSAQEWLLSFAPRRVIALYGGMGAGKTTFIKWLCTGLGVTDPVNSPTFAIVNVYDVPSGCLPGGGGRDTEEMYHFDCYRLKDLQEAMDIGTQDYLDSGRFCLIEWPQVVEPLLPDDAVCVRFSVLPDGRRLLEAE